jgi:hypothetical protein
MAAADPIIPEPRRFLMLLPRPLWIGMSTVVLVGMAVGLRFGLPIYRQWIAIREIERMGGYVTTIPTINNWLRRRLDKGTMKSFDEVVDVRLTGNRATDSTLRHMKLLRSLRTLVLYGTQVTDAGLEHLEGLTSLEWLDLTETRVKGEGLGHLKELPELRHLVLDRAPVTDGGLNHLKGPRSLKRSFSNRPW